MAQTFTLVRPVLQRDSEDNKTVLDAPKWYEMHQNVSLGTNGVDRGAFVVKNPDATSWHELLH